MRRQRPQPPFSYSTPSHLSRPNTRNGGLPMCPIVHDWPIRLAIGKPGRSLSIQGAPSGSAPPVAVPKLCRDSWPCAKPTMMSWPALAPFSDSMSLNRVFNPVDSMPRRRGAPPLAAPSTIAEASCPVVQVSRLPIDADSRLSTSAARPGKPPHPRLRPPVPRSALGALSRAWS